MKVPKLSQPHLPAVLVLLLVILSPVRLLGQATGAASSQFTNDDLGSDPTCKHRDIWGPFKPKPGHPTGQEKNRFRELVSGYAKDAEAVFGVPAAAITGMAILESAFGFTRLALNANNIFGYTFPVHDTIGLRHYVLKNCYPESGSDKDYVWFENYGESVKCVAMRLAALPRYSAVTRRYSQTPVDQRSRAAVVAWVVGIAKAGYASPADDYARKIIRIMNSPDKPSDTVAPDNLYVLSVTK